MLQGMSEAEAGRQECMLWVSHASVAPLLPMHLMSMGSCSKRMVQVISIAITLSPLRTPALQARVAGEIDGRRGSHPEGCRPGAKSADEAHEVAEEGDGAGDERDEHHVG